jgi:hypothetical protein
MEEKNLFKSSNEILELDRSYEDQARELVKQLQPEKRQNFFVEIDCAPNGQLNLTRYGNGLKSAEIIFDLANSFLGTDKDDLKNKIEISKTSDFQTNYCFGEKIGLWQRVRVNDYEKLLDFSQPFCVKNEKGLTKIWYPHWRLFGNNNGFATKGSIIKFIAEETAYLQKFYMPLAAIGISYQRMTYRLVFFCSVLQEAPEFIGGLWISRPGFKIYPDKDSTVGIIAPQK